MERIVNLHYKKCPKLFKYILKNKKEIVFDRWKLIYIHVLESEIEKLKEVNGLEKEVEFVLNSRICHNCGVRTTVGFIASYRGQECIGKVVDCPTCYPLGDKAWYKVKSLSGEDKYNHVRKLMSRWS